MPFKYSVGQYVITVATTLSIRVNFYYYNVTYAQEFCACSLSSEVNTFSVQRYRCRVGTFTGLKSNRITNRDLSPVQIPRNCSPLSNTSSNASASTSTDSTPTRLCSNQSTSQSQIVMLLQQQKELEKKQRKNRVSIKTTAAKSG